jgi:DNA-binding transcriptional LysR family regulator
MEEELGDALLTRSTRKVALTEIGESYLFKCEKILDEIETTHRVLKEARDVPAGVLRVTSTVSFGKTWIAPLLGDFLAQYPQIKLELSLSDRVADIIQDKFDVVIRAGQFDESSFLARKLLPLQRGLYASHSYLKSLGPLQDPSALSTANFLSFTSTSQMEDVWVFKNERRRMEVKLKGNLHSDNIDVVKQLAVDGAGIAVFPPWFVASEVKKKSLFKVLPDWEPMPPKVSSSLIYLLYPKTAATPLKTKVFVDFLTQRIRRDS